MLKSRMKYGLAVALLATPTVAQSDVGQVGVKNVEVLQGWRTDAGTHMSAVRITLKNGWKTYWRAPGGNGIPPNFDWEGSKNLDSVIFHWPSPTLFTQFGIHTIGYKGEFTLPIEIKPTIAGQPITLKTQLDFGVCSEVCVPVTSYTETELTADNITYQSEIETALAARPQTVSESGIQAVSCQISSIEGGKSIIANIAFKDTAPNVQQTVFEYPGSSIWVEQVALENAGRTIMAQAELFSYSNDTLELDQNDLRLTLLGKNLAIEINGCATPS